MSICQTIKDKVLNIDMRVDFFATIEVEIENPYGEVTLQDDEVLLQALDEGIRQADNGLLIPHNEVMQEIDSLIKSYQK